MRQITCVGLLLLTACANPFDTRGWDEEVVLWDASASRRDAEERERLERERDEAVAALENQGQPTTQASSQPIAGDTVAYIFDLEAQLADLRRAIDDGLDRDGRMAARCAGIEAERAALVERHREAYDAARAARLERIRDR